MQVDSAKEAAAAKAAAHQGDAIAADNADGLGEDRRKAVLAEAEAATAGKGLCSHHGGAWGTPRVDVPLHVQSVHMAWLTELHLLLERKNWLPIARCDCSILMHDSVAHASLRALSCS